MRMLVAAALLAAPAAAQDRSAFHAGTAIPDFGPVASIDQTTPIPADAAFAVAFDVADPADPGTRSRALESAARLMNMLVEAGVRKDNIRVAVVVHGGAAKDLLALAAYASRHDGAENASAPLIAALLDEGVTIQLCGQSAAAHGIDSADLLPGIDMALSAMTAHALLQQDGYTLNPF
ncbi:MAG: DsrE family protein [Pacificimonas sp.]